MLQITTILRHATRRGARPVVSLAVLTALAALTACAGSQEDQIPLPDAAPFADAVRQAQRDWPWIAGTEWSLALIEGQPMLEGTTASISFKPDETWMSGSTGCNRFTGGYIRRGENGLRIQNLALTKRFCSEPAGVMQQEARVTHLLTESDGYRATREWLHLTIDNTVVLSYTNTQAPPADHAEP
jgi:heat shock protein HslJ